MPAMPAERMPKVMNPYVTIDSGEGQSKPVVVVDGCVTIRFAFRGLEDELRRHRLLALDGRETPSSIFEKDIHLKVANRHMNRWKSAGGFGGYASRFRHSLNANAFSGLRSP